MLLTREMHVRLCTARELLCSTRQPALSISDVARRVGVSPFYLSRQFAAVFGDTPHQYRTSARIQRAKQLLARAELSVTAVCFELGFSSVGSFSALFSSRVGESPLAYQRRMRRLWTVPAELSPLLAPGCLSLMCFLPPEAAAQFSRSTPAVPLLQSASRSKLA
jgi:AraC-like DNA-binding protein